MHTAVCTVISWYKQSCFINFKVKGKAFSSFLFIQATINGNMNNF